MGQGGRAAIGASGYELGPWDADGTAELTAAGADPEAVLLHALTGLLDAARGGAPAGPAADAAAAVPIRGQGTDLSAVAVELGNDLLARLDDAGAGLDRVRLDGLLETDDGGYTAWGYALGRADAGPPAVQVSLDASSDLGRDGEDITLRLRLRRG